jgi:WD40 repeat protein
LVSCVAFSPDGSGENAQIAAAHSRKIQLFEAEILREVGLVRAKLVAFSPDGSKIAAAHGRKIQLFDAQTQAKLGSPLSGHSDR